MTVSDEKVAIATKFGLKNVGAIAAAADRADVPFAVACALMQKESGGRNVYGHDANGALSGFPHEVNEENFKVFRWLIFTQGQTSNGVGPAQITYKGYFTQMLTQGLQPWVPEDNIFFGLRLLKAQKRVGEETWEEAGARYNGGPTPNVDARRYGVDLQAKVEAWRERLNP